MERRKEGGKEGQKRREKGKEGRRHLRSEDHMIGQQVMEAFTSFLSFTLLE